MNPKEYARKSPSGVDGAPLARTVSRTEKPQCEKTTIHRLQRAALKLSAAQTHFEDEIRAAHYYYGMSLRKIAAAAEVSHEQVRRMISADRS